MADPTIGSRCAQVSFLGQLYFGVQALRRGVRPDQIDRCASLLEASSEKLQGFLCSRLRGAHKASGEPIQWLEKQPFQKRDDLRGAMEVLSRHRSPKRLEWRKTSGSTGSPSVLAKDMAMVAQMDATMWAAYRWHGLAPGLRHARFWGKPVSRLPRLRQEFKDLLMNRRRLDAFSLSGGRARRFFRALIRFKPVYSYGYPTLVRHFVDECLDANLDGGDIGMKVLVTTGELLSSENRELFERFFNCKVVNEYGCTESGILGMECEAGTMHVIPTAALLEVIDSGGKTAGLGESGEIVVTDLFGEVFPLLRYRLRDRGTLVDDTCSCGRNLPLIRVDLGRIDSFIQTPLRGPVYDAVLAYTIPQCVQRFRAHQVAPDRLRVDLVPGVGFSERETPRLCQIRWEEALGPGMSVIVQVVDDIPYEASGKLRYFIPMDSG